MLLHAKELLARRRPGSRKGEEGRRSIAVDDQHDHGHHNKWSSSEIVQEARVERFVAQQHKVPSSNGIRSARTAQAGSIVRPVRGTKQNVRH